MLDGRKTSARSPRPPSAWLAPAAPLTPLRPRPSRLTPLAGWLAPPARPCCSLPRLQGGPHSQGLSPRGGPLCTLSLIPLFAQFRRYEISKLRPNISPNILEGRPLRVVAPRRARVSIPNDRGELSCTRSRAQHFGRPRPGARDNLALWQWCRYRWPSSRLSLSALAPGRRVPASFTLTSPVRALPRFQRSSATSSGRFSPMAATRVRLPASARKTPTSPASEQFEQG